MNSGQSCFFPGSPLDAVTHPRELAWGRGLAPIAPGKMRGDMVTRCWQGRSRIVPIESPLTPTCLTRSGSCLRPVLESETHTAKSPNSGPGPERTEQSWDSGTRCSRPDIIVVAHLRRVGHEGQHVCRGARPDERPRKMRKYIYPTPPSGQFSVTPQCMSAPPGRSCFSIGQSPTLCRPGSSLDPRGIRVEPQRDA